MNRATATAAKRPVEFMIPGEAESDDGFLEPAVEGIYRGGPRISADSQGFDPSLIDPITIENCEDIIGSFKGTKLAQRLRAKEGFLHTIIDYFVLGDRESRYAAPAAGYDMIFEPSKFTTEAPPPPTLPRREEGKAPAPQTPWVGGPRDRLAPKAEIAATHLQNTYGFYTSEVVNAWRVRIHCGIFFVKKSNGKLRVICDARPANDLMRRRLFQTVLFSPAALLDMMGNLFSSARGRKVFCITSDIRHMFHRIQLPERFRTLFALQFRKGGVLVPIALLMGWTFAPFIAQAVTLGILLNSNGAALSQKLKIDYPALQAMVRRAQDTFWRPEMPWPKEEHPVLPPYIPLLDGGFIGVVLDNIIVATDDRKCALAWADRIRSQFKEFELHLKEEHAGMGTTPIFTLEEGKTEPVLPFIGIDFIYGATRPKIEDRSAAMPGSVDAATGIWRGTRRQLAELLGTLLWYLRATNHLLCDPWLRPFWQLLSDNAGGEGDDWDEPTCVDAEQTRKIVELWATRARGEFAVLPVMQRPDSLDSFAYGVSDAAGKGEGALAGIWFDPSGKAVSFRWNTALEKIALRELEAFRNLAREILRNQPQARALVLATDSMNTLYWVEKRYARNVAANEILYDLFHNVCCNRRVIPVYVPSERNAADWPSRHRVEPTSPEDVTKQQLCLATSWMIVAAAAEQTVRGHSAAETKAALAEERTHTLRQRQRSEDSD